jgi:hypothetical protein
MMSHTDHRRWSRVCIKTMLMKSKRKSHVSRKDTMMRTVKGLQKAI